MEANFTATHVCSFLQGKNWHTYKYLEGRFLETSRFVALVPRNLTTWSENLADLLNLTGSAVDAFFRNMHLCPIVQNRKEVSDVKRMVTKRNKKEWNIRDFLKAYEPLYELSKNEVTIPFGLSDLKERKPFEDFGKGRFPKWWIAYNHVKHQYYDKIEEANLRNVVDALGGLLILNALHKDSQKYLVKVGVLRCNSLTASAAINILKRSFVGFPKTMPASECLIVTPVFVFRLRRDPLS
jgi:hypothetical protein